MRVTLCLAALLALAACGTAEEAPRQQVASLHTGDQPATSAAPVEDERPRERIDDTPEQKRKNLDPYLRCMTDNGIPEGGTKSRPDLSSAQYREAWPKAQAKCKDKFPLPAWELDRNNPESMDFIHRVVECMRKAGVTVEEQPARPGEEQNGYSIRDNAEVSVAKGMEISSQCKKESVRK
ncbi:hypothetical protein Lesp02_26440 [Lentzea sp. NBRC 105346]|uniref:hypothetical protein n=1 Tax=Lentzea sp. NBRC 105346 TaxID=3032205 RepID=UPI002556DF07|nr:hypothetical protein [Lentzea sp. NBRC 105346]GLZ30455.1 hypothetical protein Lesp02_26440 [Lentzea sp. NBRC 105346]